MLDTLFRFLSEIGIAGLFIAMFIKGSTIPLPSLVFIVSYGFLLNPSMNEIVLLAIVMSLIFTLASFIPYTIGSKFEKKIKDKIGGKLEKAQVWFNRFGIWSVFITRPFTIGMYISYIAGMSNLNHWKYSVLTFLGILPWSIFILILSKSFKGNLVEIMSFMRSYSIPAGILIIIIISIYFVLFKLKVKNKAI